MICIICMIYSHYSSCPGSFRAYIYIPDLYDLYDLAHVAAWEPHNLRHLGHIPGLDLYYTDHAQRHITAG